MMNSRQLLAAAIVVCLGTVATAMADDVRYFEKDGVTYRETRRTVQRPVCETQYQNSTRTVYRQQQTTEQRETTRTWLSPVTEYCCEWHWKGRWNPFVQPYMERRMVPHTRWEQRTEVVKTPVTCCRMVPEAQTVQVPVTMRRMVSEEVISRVAVSSPSGTPLRPIPQTPMVARYEPIGGVARLDKDPPRYGVNSAWRPATVR